MSLIAKDADVDEIVKFLMLVLSTAAKQNAEALDLVEDEHYRHELRNIIDNSSSQLSKEDIENRGSRDDAQSTIALQVQAEVERIISRYAPLEQAYSDLQAHSSTLEENLEKFKIENSELSRKLETSSSKSKIQAEVAESQAKAQIEYLQKDVQHLEEQIGVRDKKLTDAEARLQDMASQVEQVHTDLETMVELKDMLDEARHEIDRLKKVTMQMERYKRQAEQSDALQRQVHTLKNENTYLVEKSKLLDEDTQQVFGLRKQVEILQSEIDFYRRKAKETDESAEKLREELLSMRERSSTLEDNHARDAVLISTLEEKVRTLESTAEFAGGRTLRDAQEKDYDITIEDLQREISRLQRELLNSRAQERADAVISSDTQELETYTQREIAVQSLAHNGKLEATLKDTIQAKDKLQEDYLQVYRENLVLQSQLDALEDETESGDEIARLRTALKDVKEQLEQKRLELRDLQKQYAELEDKFTQSESDCMRCLPIYLNVDSSLTLLF